MSSLTMSKNSSVKSRRNTEHDRVYVEDTHTCGWTNDLNEATRSTTGRLSTTDFAMRSPEIIPMACTTVVIEGQMPSYKSYHFGSYNYYKMDQKIGVDDIYVSNTGCGKCFIDVPRCPLATYTANFGDERVCLYFNTTATTWSKAVKSCRQMSPFGHLVSVENEEKQKLIVNFINNQGDFNIAAQHGGVWTSGADLDTEGSWRWTNTDRGVNYTDWKPGQPNNVGDRQNCLVLDYPEDNYTWGDEYCDLEKPFICQMSYDRSVVDRPQ
ncbi:C-type lectin-like [Liolophura sinensis]|uniref:C-type lectin-like n=1 Tax=Liolophura sinensis TaxID=3198878 RepID=UPI0031594FF5